MWMRFCIFCTWEENMHAQCLWHFVKCAMQRQIANGVLFFFLFKASRNNVNNTSYVAPPIYRHKCQRWFNVDTFVHAYAHVWSPPALGPQQSSTAKSEVAKLLPEPAQYISRSGWPDWKQGCSPLRRPPAKLIVGFRSCWNERGKPHNRARQSTHQMISGFSTK